MSRVVVLLFSDDGDLVAQRRVLASTMRCTGARTAPMVVLAGRSPDPDAVMGLPASTVLLLEHPGAAQPSQADQLVAMLAELIASEPEWQSGQTLFVLAAGLLGEEVSARLAARLDGTALGRCSGIELDDGGIRARRGAYGGKVELTLRSTTQWLFVALRGDDAQAGQQDRDCAPVRRRRSQAALARTRNAWQIAASGSERLDDARVVVAGGRGMGGTEGFAMLRELALALGGAVGGSLPTIDEGWLPIAQQIGQSGRLVAPEIYLAVAISGTLQHLAGISPSTRIVAINLDPAANIFQHAEMGAVGDWRELLPRLLTRLREEVLSG